MKKEKLYRQHKSHRPASAERSAKCRDWKNFWSLNERNSLVTTFRLFDKDVNWGKYCLNYIYNIAPVADSVKGSGQINCFAKERWLAWLVVKTNLYGAGGRGRQNGLFLKILSISTCNCSKGVYIRKSSVILELNASVDPAKLIRKLWKIFQSWLEKLFEVWYIIQPTLFGSLLQKRESWKKIKTSKKFWKS